MRISASRLAAAWLAILASSLALGAEAQAPARMLQIRADLWCPYNCDPASDRPGFMIEIARRSLAPHGVGVEYRTMPWARALLEVRAGGIDGVVGANVEDARGLVMPPRPYGRSEDVLVVRRGERFVFDGPAAFGDRRVAIVLDYAYSDTINEWLEVNRSDPRRVQPASGDDALPVNLRKLMASRVDVVIEDENVAHRAIGAMGLSDRVEIVMTGESQDLFIALGRHLPDAQVIAGWLADGIDALRDSGELDTILSRYGMRDWRR